MKPNLRTKRRNLPVSRWMICQFLSVSLVLFFSGLLWFSLTGCQVLKILSTSQKWSENYVLNSGTTSNDPAMIDGNLETIGETKYIESTSKQTVRGFMVPSEGIVMLPKPKTIKKIIIHSQNLQSFDLFILESNGNWKHTKEVKNIIQRPYNLILNVPIYTAGLKIRVNKTSDDDALRRQNVRKIQGVSMFSGHTKALAKINEIEAYGFVESVVQ